MPMNTNLLNALNQIVSQYGVETLSNARRVKALLADLAVGEPKPQKNALIACIEQGYPAMLQNAQVRERGQAKAKLAERLNLEEGLDPLLCADTLDIFGGCALRQRFGNAGNGEADSGAESQSVRAGWRLLSER
jgi:hypothetical protein